MKLLLLIILSVSVHSQSLRHYDHFNPYHFVMLRFSESMDTTTLRPKENYTVFDQDLNEISIYSTGLTFSNDSLMICNDSTVVLVVPKLAYKTSFVIRAMNVKNLAGNVISDSADAAWFYFDGFDPEQTIPTETIRRK